MLGLIILDVLASRDVVWNDSAMVLSGKDGIWGLARPLHIFVLLAL